MGHLFLQCIHFFLNSSEYVSFDKVVENEITLIYVCLCFQFQIKIPYYQLYRYI